MNNASPRLAILLALALSGCAPQALSAMPSGASANSLFLANAHAVRRLPAEAPAIFYVALKHEVTIYSQANHHPKLGSITSGIHRPRGLWVDAAGTLYVANHGDVTVYPAGSTSPSLTLRTGLSRPVSVAVDAAGTVYVGDLSGQIVEYPAGQTTPSVIIPPLLVTSSQKAWPYGVTIDADGNLAVAYFAFQSSEIVEYAPGTTTPIYVGITVASAYGVTFDNHGLLLVSVPDNQSAGWGIFVFKLNPVHFQRVFGMTAGPVATAFNARANKLYAADPGGYADIFDYPRGILVDRVKTAGFALGIAMSPPMSL